MTIHYIEYVFYPTSSGIASCVGTMGMVMCHLHLMRPCSVALGQVLIWGLNPAWLRSFVNWVSSFPEGPVRSEGKTSQCCWFDNNGYGTIKTWIWTWDLNICLYFSCTVKPRYFVLKNMPIETFLCIDVRISQVTWNKSWNFGRILFSVTGLAIFNS